MTHAGGTKLGPYVITREIGRGGMGVVYLARDTKLDRAAAVVLDKRNPAALRFDLLLDLCKEGGLVEVRAKLVHDGEAVSEHFFATTRLTGPSIAESYRSTRLSQIDAFCGSTTTPAARVPSQSVARQLEAARTRTRTRIFSACNRKPPTLPFKRPSGNALRECRRNLRCGQLWLAEFNDGVCKLSLAIVLIERGGCIVAEDTQQNEKPDVEEREFFPAETDPFDYWENKQRELVTSVVDYNLGTLADLVRAKTIDLSPTYQRRFRWDNQRQSRLIESFLMNVPVPPVFLNEDQYGKYSVIDGKQRLTAISEFMAGRLKLTGLTVFSDVNGMTFDDLPAELQTVVKLRPTLRAVIILRQSDLDIKFEVFQRLNTGGVRLNAQEIRNSTYPGPVNDMVLRLSEHTDFHKLLGIKSKKRSSIYQQMRDAEFVVRYFTFRDLWRDISGGMKRRMDTFMSDHQIEPEEWRNDLEKDFINTVYAVDAAFGSHAFHRWQPGRGRWRRQVLASLFDAEMFACRGREPAHLRTKRDQIIDSFKALFEDQDFRKLIDAATNTPSFFRRRIEKVTEIIDEVV